MNVEVRESKEWRKITPQLFHLSNCTDGSIKESEIGLKERYQNFHLTPVKFNMPLDIQVEISNWQLKYLLETHVQCL